MQNAFTIDRKTLSDALKLACKVVERRNTIPILSYVLVDIRADRVVIVGTDLDLQMVTELPAETHGQPARLCVELRTFADAVGKFKGDTVRLADMGGGAADLQCGATGAKARLSVLPATDFPAITVPEMPHAFSLPAVALRSALTRTAAAMSTEETRYYLNGVFLHALCLSPRERTAEHETLATKRAELDQTTRAGDDEDADALAARRRAVREEIATIDAQIAPLEALRTAPDSIRFAATDGHRLARVTAPLPVGAAGIPDMIIPRKVAGILAKSVLAGRKAPIGDVAVECGPTRIRFAYGRTILYSKLIDGTFPDYSRVVPTCNPHRLHVPREKLIEAVEAVTAVCTEKTRAVSFGLAKGEPMILSAKGDAGTSAVVFDGATLDLDGDDQGASFGCNAAYLRQALECFNGPIVQFHLADAQAPLMLASNMDGDEDFALVLMPMRVDSIICTREGVERLGMNVWQQFEADAAELAAQIASVRADLGKLSKSNRRHVLSSLAKRQQDAIAFLVEQGDGRAYARAAVAAALAPTTSARRTFATGSVWSRKAPCAARSG